jgi:predicted DNA-binding transcriptional regulator YafY
MYQPAARVLTVLELLQTRGLLRAQDLAAALEVEPRSVRRYVTMLQDIGIPVVSERGRHGGYRLRPGYKLPPLMLTDDEALAVTLGLMAARRFGLGAGAPAVEGALAKIERVLPDRVRAEARALQQAVVFDVPRGLPVPEAVHVRLFGRAIEAGHGLRIRYRSPRGESEREVDPYGLVYRVGTWYAPCWCHLRGDLRLFRLDRVVEAAPSGRGFTRPAGFDARAVVQQRLSDVLEPATVELLIDGPAGRIREQLWFDPEAVHETGDGVRVRFRSDDLRRTAHTLLWLPWPVRVLEPAALLDEIERVRRRAERIVSEAGA